VRGAATVHLAAYSPVTPFIEFAAAEVFASPLRAALQEAGLPVRKGGIALPTTPGIGYELPDEIVRRYRM
jgi:L-alanine-DL-glutamate epimerase-like enolase superfamily enzyme